MDRDQAASFRKLCEERGIAVTQQRQVLYEVMQGMTGHPSPEEVYAQVRLLIPTISLATVYKNIHLFVQSGVLREVSLHHGTRRVELAAQDHHHAVCSSCKAIFDVDESELGPMHRHDRLSGGFLIERYAVDIIGLCIACQQAAPSAEMLASHAAAVL